jgi:carbon storage regulator
MLVLTRKVGETLMIGDDVQVVILGTKGNQVRVGVKAPKETVIDREEIRMRRDAGIPHVKQDRS